MYSVDFGPIEQAQHAGQWDALAGMLEDAAQRLHRGGADCVVLCTNTMHKVADHVAASVPIPFLHIADPVGRKSTQNGTKVLGLLGTRFTMEQPFLRQRLEQAYGLQVLVPDEEDRAEVHRIIYEELCTGVVRDTSRQTYQRIIDSLACGARMRSCWAVPKSRFSSSRRTVRCRCSTPRCFTQKRRWSSRCAMAPWRLRASLPTRLTQIWMSSNKVEYCI